MNKIGVLIMTFALLLINAGSVSAQNKNKDIDESKYLVGAVPQVDGKVVFSKEYSIPGLTENEIYDRMLKWAEKEMKETNNPKSRVVYTKQEDGIIAVSGEQWIVFKSSALSLDRTLINYYLTIECKPELCKIEIDRIKYTYRETEKYSADEWIIDDFSLNKSKTKMIRGLSKWRIKTVDFANDMFNSAAQALSSSEVAVVKKESKEEAVTTNGPIVIKQNNVITEKSKEVIPTTSIPAIPLTPAKKISEEKLVEVNPSEIPTNTIKASEGKIVIAIGSDQYNMTMMTADAGGAIVTIGGKPTMVVSLSPDQSYQALQNAKTYTVRFFPNGENDPTAVLECTKVDVDQPHIEGMPRSFMGTITKAWVKK